MTACKSNLKNIATALEMYADDHEGTFPESLEALTPEYLRQIMVCPSAEKDTYSSSYSRNTEPDGYVMRCHGENHHILGAPDYPAYDAVNGLAERP